MLERQSLADADAAAISQACRKCGRTFQPWALYVVNRSIRCGECIHEANAARRKAPPALAASDWASEPGKALKADRDRALDASRWAIMPDSPLTAACRDAFARYLRALHRMTVDYTPETWTWPDVPALQYEEQ